MAKPNARPQRNKYSARDLKRIREEICGIVKHVGGACKLARITGISHASIYFWMNGKQVPSPMYLKMLLAVQRSLIERRGGKRFGRDKKTKKK